MSEGRPDDLEDYWFGPQDKFEELKMECITHKKPEFENKYDNENLEIKFRCPVPIKSSCNFIQCRTDKKCPEMILHRTNGEEVSYVLSFPEHGWYKFMVFAEPADKEGKSLSNAYNYLIDCRRALSAVYPYPTQFTPYRVRNCYLDSPLVLHEGSRLANVKFKVILPGATAAAVVAEQSPNSAASDPKDWFQLKPGDGKDVWEGTAQLDKHRGKGHKVKLCACWDQEKEDYDALLNYVI